MAGRPGWRPPMRALLSSATAEARQPAVTASDAVLLPVMRVG